MFSDITHLATWISLATFLMTAIGGFFIIQTFALQAKTSAEQTELLKIQQRMADIENERYRIEYKPIFKLSDPTTTDRVIGDFTHSAVHFKLKLIKNDSKQFNVIAKNTSSSVEKVSLAKYHSGTPLPLVDFYMAEEYDLHIELKSRTDLYSGEGAFLHFFILYMDALGNSYSHEHVFVIESEKFTKFDRAVTRIITS